MIRYALGAVVGAVILAGGLYFLLAGIGGEKPAGNVASQPHADPPSQTAPAGLFVEDIKRGEGREVRTGDTVSVHYVGTLTDGTKFDSSRDRGEPFSFTLGQGRVIQGWEQGIPGMKIGGVRKLVIPPDLAYGERAVGSISPRATLTFEVELLGIK